MAANVKWGNNPLIGMCGIVRRQPPDAIQGKHVVVMQSIIYARPQAPPVGLPCRSCYGSRAVHMPWNSSPPTSWHVWLMHMPDQLLPVRAHVVSTVVFNVR
jgi:hypothetical protein